MSRPQWRAGVDTRTLYRPGPRPSLQQAPPEGAFVAIWSPWIIAELNHVLTWQWAARIERDADPAHSRIRGDRSYLLTEARRRDCAAAAKTMMSLLLSTFELVHPVPPFPDTWPAF